MKNLFYLFLAVFLTSFATPKETIVISGKILNSENGKVTLLGELFIKEITLKADGTFSETVDIDYDGTYTLSTSKNRTSLYLAKGTKLQLSVDENDFNKTLKYTGSGSAENQYIADKNTLIGSIKTEDLYKQDEKDFLVKISELKKTLTGNLNKAKLTQANFKENELENLYFFEQAHYLNYPKYHAHYAKIEDFKVSETFPKFDEKINLDDSGNYLFSNPYKQIVSIKFDEKVAELMNGKDDYTADFAIPLIEKLKSQYIKNALCQNLYYELSPGNPSLNYLYQSLIKISTDEKFKEKTRAKYDKLRTLAKGNPSPTFSFDNHKGGKTSLASLKGKYVYIDVWATWCGPCRKEIPSLQKIEERYQGKNIEFVSISVDARKDYDKWYKMVSEKQMGGQQLFSDSDWKSQFVQDYAIDSIPRFIIIDPNGNIINADAPRPSDEKLIELFNSLQI